MDRKSGLFNSGYIFLIFKSVDSC